MVPMPWDVRGGWAVAKKDVVEVGQLRGVDLGGLGRTKNFTENTKFYTFSTGSVSKVSPKCLQSVSKVFAKCYFVKGSIDMLSVVILNKNKRRVSCTFLIYCYSIV